MAGFNLPPGCNVSDIPGNRPGDNAAEAFENALCAQFPAAEKLLESEADADQLAYNLIVEVAEWAFSEGTKQGYADGSADAATVASIEESRDSTQRDTILAKMRGNLNILSSYNEVRMEEEVSGHSALDPQETLRNQRRALDNLARLVDAMALQ